MSLNIGDAAPSFNLPSTTGEDLSSESLAGKRYVLFFYPKDNTPGCTTESCDFTAAYGEFANHNCEILGVSKDSIKSHTNFKTKHSMPFELISDPDETLCRAYDVIKMKSMYGKQFEGIERSTFLVDEQGIIQEIWRKVKVKGHVDEVLQRVKAL